MWLLHSTVNVSQAYVLCPFHPPNPMPDQYSIAIGAIVKLIIGGPAMIVSDCSSTSATCRWFNGASLSKEVFALHVLRPLTAEEIAALS
jgi:uncharacterized protein YodC (DUF2158 family)